MQPSTSANPDDESMDGSGRGILLTVVCACLNAAATLALQLDALASQATDFAWELIMVDDGSTDGTPALTRRYADRIANLRVIESPAGLRPQADGMNIGAANAAGRYVVFLDGDDEIAPGYLAAMKAALDEHPVVAARIDDEALNPPYTRVRMEPMQRHGLTVMHDFLPVTVGAAMGIHKDVFDKVDGWDVESTPLLDIDLSWRLQLAGFSIAFCPGAVLRYRYRTGLRATYRQKRNYAIGDVFVMKRFRPMGAPRRTPIDTVRGWWHLVLSGVKVRDRRSAMLFVDRLGSAVGRIQGSIRYRYLFL